MNNFYKFSFLSCLFLFLVALNLQRTENNRLQRDVLDLEQNLKNVSKEFEKLQSQVSIVNASINPDNKRWVRIKQIRKAILDFLKFQGINNLSIREITEISAAVLDSSEQNNVSVPLILAIITVESNFNIRAVSKADARGLMQILPDTASDIAVELGKRNFNLFNVRDNIQFGSFYIWKMMNLFKNEQLGISAYNCGPMYVERVMAGTISAYPAETVDYLKRVQEWKVKYETLGVE